jgi:hypothetical protein
VLDQVRRWVERRGRRWDERRYQQAEARAQAAQARLGGQSVEAWLQAAGVSVIESPAPARFGTALVRATVDLDTRQITVYRETVPSDQRGTVIAHEAFHLLDPDCPDPVAEMAAHLFAARTTPIAVFPGALDP